MARGSNGRCFVDTDDALIVDLLEWIGPEPRPYSAVQEVWRTTCPKLPVWEDAMGAGYIERRSGLGQDMFVVVTAKGAALLEARVDSNRGTK
jgi:trans-aconitate 2-methyltransferase